MGITISSWSAVLIRRDDAAKLSTNLLSTREKVALVIFIVTEGQYDSFQHVIFLF